MLLIGPPGSGKTRQVMDRLEAALRDGRPAQLVVPTASMAEHLLDEMARRGWATAAGVVLSLADFVASLTPECREAPPATAVLLVKAALARTRPAEFEAVEDYPGFQLQLLATFQEVWAAGGADLPLGAFGQVMAEYERLLGEAGLVHRSERLRLAAARVRERRPEVEEAGAVLLDGFFNFTSVELELVRALAASADPFLVTLPDEGAEEARQAIITAGIEETRLESIYRPAVAPVLISAPSPEREIEDIAGRILRDRAETGRPFRDYGLILRHPPLYGALIATVFERFGIPFRSRTPQRLQDQSAIRFLAGLLRVATTGFDGIETLDLLKLAASGLGLGPEMDRYEFALRGQTPESGLAFLRRHAAPYPGVDGKLAEMEELERWAGERLPPAQWSERCEDLARRWFHPPVIDDGVSHETVLAWRSLGASLRGWQSAAAEAAEVMRLDCAASASLEEYCHTLDAVLKLTPLRVPDRRRNVVQVLSVHEARQWELPVVFVCGLVEKQFPRHHAQNLFFPDAERRRLAARGIPLRTTADLDREEVGLFHLARTRATARLFFTFPAQDETGGENLRSFFLADWPLEAMPAERVRPAKTTTPSWTPSSGRLEDPALADAVSRRHKRFSPTSLERYLQCPFQFFARDTLRLQESPARPEERFDARIKGSIIHRAIARWAASGAGDIGPVFEQVLDEVCRETGIRLNFRSEIIRANLREDLERFASQDRQPPAGFRAGPPESEFEYVVEETDPPFRLAGKIDRHEVSETGAAVVIDYKYSGENRIRAIVEEHEAGERIQAPLYLLGLERQQGLTPAGMVYWGLRGESSRAGWYVRGLVPPDKDLEENSPEEFRALLDAAERRAGEIVAAIRRGSVAVAPRDRGFCARLCAFRDVCRVDL